VFDEMGMTMTDLSNTLPTLLGAAEETKTMSERPSITEPTDDTVDATKENQESQDKIQRKLRKFLFVPYFVGIIWTCLHPIASILTGELKCRGWYIDEHALDTQFASTMAYEAPRHLVVNPPTPQSAANLCDVFNTSIPNLSCHRHAKFHLASLVPVSSAVQPLEEAIVLVVPTPTTGDWTSSKFHYMLVHSLKGLANPLDTPWLAKTILLVSPASSDVSLHDTVADFLDAYLGSKQTSSSTISSPLPTHLTGAMLRNLIVVDVQAGDDVSVRTRRMTNKDRMGRTDVTILPQGKRGVLPNMDLVFAVGKLFEKSLFGNPQRHPGSTVLVHPYLEESKLARDFLDEKLVNGKPKLSPNEKKLRMWAEGMADLGLFAYSLARGPWPPHAPALDRGIDSLTIQVIFHGTYYRDPVVELIQYLEYLIRALSNLHERLHHSVTLYLMPSPKMFVSHIEYFLPNILVLLPLAIRVFILILYDMKQMHVRTVGWTFLMALTTMGIMLLSSALPSDDATTNTLLAIPYLTVLTFWTRQLYQYNREKDATRILASVQFVVCFTAIYIHVPIAFSHASLGYPSSLLWVPLLAFPNWASASSKGLKRAGLLVLLVATAPPLLIATIFGGDLTPFVQFAYMPLHVQLFMLWITRMFY
jgi:glycosylphosphatidylinositol transamidase